MSDKEKFSIYRLDETLFSEGEERNFDIIENRIEAIAQGKGYEEIRLNIGDNGLHGLRIKLFHKRMQNNYGIWNFIEGVVNNEQRRTIKEKYKSLTNHDVIYLYTTNYVYGVSSGAGYKVFENDIDNKFTIQILKKSLEPTFKLSDTRSISGHTHATQEVFRGSYSFDKVESFGKIFKKLAGKLRRDSLLGQYFATARSHNAIIKDSSIKVGSSVNIEELVFLIRKLEEVYQTPLNNEEQQQFSFLDTLIPINLPERKEFLLKEFFNQKILPYLKEETGEIDITFCTPEHISTFFCGNRYILKRGTRNWSFDTYSISGILNEIKTHDDFLHLTLDRAFNNWKEYSIIVELETGGTDHDIKCGLYKSVHGEFVYNDKYYFIIDGNVYELSEDFRMVLDEDIRTILDNQDNIINTIPFITGGNIGDEGEFNERHINDNFLCCDRIFIEGGAKVELFDILYEEQDTLYLIHVKNGFGNAIRDVCSQIENGAKYIEEDFRKNPTNPKCIRDLYDKIINYTGDDRYKLRVQSIVNTMNFDTFKEKFNKKRVYVIGIIVPRETGVNNLGNSYIARHELVNTKIIFNQKYNNALKIAFITPTV